MRAFWFNSLLAAISKSAFWANYTSLYVLSLGGTRTQVGWMSSASSFARHVDAGARRNF